MTSLESKAVFTARAKEIGVSDAELLAIASKGWDTYGAFAFATTYVPGAADDTKLMKLISVVTGVGASDPPEDRVPIISRLFTEAYTMSATDLKARVEQKPSDEPKSLPVPERAARLKNQKTRLAGMEIRGELEPSYALSDMVVNMHELNQLKYLAWEKCTKREAEIMGVKVEKVWKPGHDGLVREVAVAQEMTADMSTDLLLQNTLTRRDLAFDQNLLADFDVFRKWTNILIRAYTAEAPEGFQKVTIEQLHRADIKLFELMMEECVSGIKPTLTGKPLNDALNKFRDHPEVRLLLTPLPGKKVVSEHDTPPPKR